MFDAISRFIPIILAVTAVFAIIELGLTAYLVSPFDWTPAPSRASFMLFNSLWSLLVLAYIGLTPLYFPRIFVRIAAVVIEWITVIFWFAGSIALAAGWGTSHCGGDRYCGSAQAAIAFGFFLWALFTVVAVVHTLEFMRGCQHTAPSSYNMGQKPYVGA